jgi:hypothetical protein
MLAIGRLPNGLLARCGAQQPNQPSENGSSRPKRRSFTIIRPDVCFHQKPLIGFQEQVLTALMVGSG